MKVNDLSKQLGVTNKALLDCLNNKGFGKKLVSHMNEVTDEMIDYAIDCFSKKDEEVVEDQKSNEGSEKAKPTTKKIAPPPPVKFFAMDDMIPCRSVIPYKLVAVGVDKNTIYNWEYFGDIDYVSYRDLQSWRKKEIVTNPDIIIEDLDLVNQWRREIGEIYKPFLGVDYPEELFDKSDEEFEKMVKHCSPTVKEVIKITARAMIKNENYPSIKKIDIIDKAFGTCLKEFL